MKALNSLTLVFTIALIVAGREACSRPSFYYAFSEKIQIKANPKKILIQFRNELGDSTTAISAFAGRSGSQPQHLALRKTGAFTGILSGQKDFSSKEKKNFGSMPNVKTALDVLETNEGTEMAYKDKICLRFKNGVSKEEAGKILSAFGLTIVQQTDFMIGKIRAGDDALEIANTIYETGKVEYAHPDFRAPIVLAQVPNDPYFNFQWNFHNRGQVINDDHTGTPGSDINAVAAWRVARGRDVIVAVLDEGVTSDHEDLPNTRQIRLDGSNFDPGGNPNDPSPSGNGNHGNAVAGLIAAEMNNNLGITGIAPKAKILPIKMLDAEASGVANALDFARINGAQVISNSWAYNSDTPNLFPVIVDAINRALTLGRGGKGCVVTFAAGNFAWQIYGDPGFLAFPSNVPGVITVGASDRYDRQAVYSPTSPDSGDQIDIVAPSHRAYPRQIFGETWEVWSLDIPGNAGYNPDLEARESLPTPGSTPTWDSYTGRMGGTSSASPQVAGVAALILSIKPGLTQQEVVSILTRSADQVGPYDYSSGRSREMGFGRLNAARAIRMAVPIPSTIVH